MTATSVLAGSTKPKATTTNAAECYRKIIAFARNEPHFYDPHFIDHFQDLIDRLEPQATAAAD